MPIEVGIYCGVHASTRLWPTSQLPTKCLPLKKVMIIPPRPYVEYKCLHAYSNPYYPRSQAGVSFRADALRNDSRRDAIARSNALDQAMLSDAWGDYAETRVMSVATSR